jgi:putative transposase
LELRCRADEAIALIERAAAAYAIQEGELTLGSDNGSAFPARRFRARLGELGIRHRRGGYRDPESQAFIESWFGKLKQREVWLNEYETLDDARRGIGGYVDRDHQRPHSSLNDRTPLEVVQTWVDHRATKTRGLARQHRREQITHASIPAPTPISRNHQQPNDTDAQRATHADRGRWS